MVLAQVGIHEKKKKKGLCFIPFTKKLLLGRLKKINRFYFCNDSIRSSVDMLPRETTIADKIIKTPKHQPFRVPGNCTKRI